MAAAQPRVIVDNAGVGGQNSSEGRERFKRDVLDAHPQVLLLYFGMNDAVNEAKMLAPEAYAENMAWMVQTARAAGILPIVSTIQHVDATRVLQRHPASVYGDAGPNGRIDQFNLVLRKLALEQRITLADFEAAFDSAGGPTVEMSTDGVHLRAEGYALLARTFLHAIPADSRQASRIVALGDSLTYGVPLRTADHDSDKTYPAVLQRLLNAEARKQP
ncbi:MAG: SGNH/GDSL hydrolase family protein [Granulicella sp.]